MPKVRLENYLEDMMADDDVVQVETVEAIKDDDLIELEGQYDSIELDNHIRSFGSYLSANFRYEEKGEEDRVVMVGVSKIEFDDYASESHCMSVSPEGNVIFDYCYKDIVITKKDAKKIIEQRIEDAQDILSKLQLALSYVNK